MTNFRTKLTSLILAACMLCAMSVSASDCEPINTGSNLIRRKSDEAATC